MGTGKRGDWYTNPRGQSETGVCADFLMEIWKLLPVVWLIFFFFIAPQNVFGFCLFVCFPFLVMFLFPV